MTKPSTKILSVAAIAAVAISLLAANMTTQVGALLPADKIGIAGSNLATSPLTVTTAGSTSQDITLLGPVTIKNSSPADLIITHTQECSILTNVFLSSTKGSNTVQTSTAVAHEEVWVEMDGVPIPVSSQPSPDDGHVTFCDRTFSVSTNILNQIQLLCSQQVTNQCTESNFTSYINTKSAHGFNWITLNVGSGTHTITVKAHLTVTVSGSGSATVVIGKRTLVVDPEHLANNAVI